MSERDAYLAKALENLSSAEGDLAQQRYNSCMRSAYYACFHAALVGLMQAGVMTSQPERLWGHDRVQAQFVGQLIGRRKLYPARLRRTLSDLLGMRHKADYRSVNITSREARRAVEWAQDFVQTIRAHVSPEGG